VDLTDQWDNFVHAMYGQVHGGTGWHSAIEDCRTTDTNVAAQATWEYFARIRRCCWSASAGRTMDFFLPSEVMIFPAGSSAIALGQLSRLWAALMLLLLRCVRSAAALLGRLSLLLAVFVGVVLSVPFLPPWTAVRLLCQHHGVLLRAPGDRGCRTPGVHRNGPRVGFVVSR
jgi:hypothetical protein